MKTFWQNLNQDSAEQVSTFDKLRWIRSSCNSWDLAVLYQRSSPPLAWYAAPWRLEGDIMLQMVFCSTILQQKNTWECKSAQTKTNCWRKTSLKKCNEFFWSGIWMVDVLPLRRLETMLSKPGTVGQCECRLVFDGWTCHLAFFELKSRGVLQEC